MPIDELDKPPRLDTPDESERILDESDEFEDLDDEDDDQAEDEEDFGDEGA